MKRGIAVSPGVAIGTAYVIHEIFVNPDRKSLADSEVTAELANYETSRDKAGAELRALERKVATQVGPEEAAIFAVHRAVSYTHLRAPRDRQKSRMPSSA